MRHGCGKFLVSSVLAGLAFSSQAIAHPDSDQPAPPDGLAVTSVIQAGSGDNTYRSVPEWGQFPEGRKTLGPTHGGVVVDKQGLIYVTLDKPPAGEKPVGIVVYSADGKIVRTIANDLWGIHGLCINEENGEQFLYGAHLAGKEAVKLKLDGTVIWKIGVPNESGKYEPRPGKDGKMAPPAYSPTGICVGPNGHVYVVDGYGQNWCHEFDEHQKYVRSFGGPGTEPGKFKTCHGIALDTRGPKPLLLICDRANLRLQHFDLDGNFVEIVAEKLRLPCSLSFHGDHIAIAELGGRVAILDGNNKLVATLGDNPNVKQRANYKVPPAEWQEGIFNAAHGISYDKDGNLYVEDWNASGRISKMEKIKAEARAE